MIRNILLHYWPICKYPVSGKSLKIATWLTISGVIICFAILSLPVSAQKKWQKESLKVDPIVCHATDETGHAYVAPPEGFLNRLKSGNKTSDIVIQYVNTPDSVKPAFEYATEIWEYLLSSPVTIYMKVTWQPLAGRTLGSCGVANFYADFEGAPIQNIYYPVAIVEKITRKELTGPGSPDMIARFNSSVSWYLGVDGKTPLSKYDLVSTVLHEIAHGLGFTGFFQADTIHKAASYGDDDGLPAIYDQYVENFNKNRLTDQTYFKNFSNNLYNAIISNQLYSGSPVAAAWSFDNRPRLFAPSTYSSGSSIYHLNDDSYPYGTINTLMTSGAGRGEAVHSPGPLTLGMLADLGWKLLIFRFEPLNDREEIIDSLVFTAAITSDLGIRDRSACLVYSYDRFKSHKDSVLLRQNDEPGIYSAALLPQFSNGTVSYYLAAHDTVNRRFTSPVYFPGSYYTLTIGPDKLQPVITHQPVKFILSTEKAFDIVATVTDNTGVNNVKVVFEDNGLEITRNLEKAEEDVYRGNFNLTELGLENQDTLKYAIVATDLAKVKNTRRMPVKGTFSIKREEIRKPVTSYTCDFDQQQDDFILADFKISRETNFDNYALHSPHPYPSPDRDNDSLVFTTIFRYPVIIAENGKMSFDEVVLVEPGEEGAVYGSSEFWDYVIVEGSKDNGKNWMPLADGYDSGSQPTWLATYKGKLVGNNSTASGSENLFVNRVIPVTGNGNFRAGDTILIRFRLHSDPYAHGWGWAIDNLNIQNNTTSTPVLLLSPGNLTIWPNPAGNVINCTINAENPVKQVDIEISDLTGRVLLKEIRMNVLPRHVINLDISNLPAGILLLRLKTDESAIVSGKIIKLQNNL